MRTKKSPPAKPAKTRILLVDDHPLLRKGIAQSIEQEPDLTVCGQAGNVDEALQALTALKPDLVLADISMPGRDGLELIKEIRASQPACLILVLSMHEESLYAERVLRAGARGYVMKHEPPETFLQAIRQVLAGKLVVGKGAVDRVLRRVTAGQSLSDGSPIDRLSDRELEIFRLIGRGLDRQQIATALQVSVKTIEAHRANTRRKLGVSNATELYHHAVEFLRDESHAHPGKQAGT